MSDLVVSVRQIGSYPALTSATGSEAVLLQQGGLGGAYASISTAALVSTALASGSLPLDVANTVNANALQLPNAGSIKWNGTGILEFDATTGLNISYAPGPPLLNLSPSGALKLTNGTLTVARDPGSALEVATMQWVGNHTVASFNARNGAVQLWSSDIYSALGLCSPIATEQWVTDAINTALQNLLMTCPFVNRWNGRVGSVYLMLSDISCVFMQPGQQPITQTPPPTSDDNSIANTQWVVQYVTDTLAGNAGLATQAWVQANTVASFNGRTGPVTLALSDITAAGGAPLTSPQLSGTPTAPTQALGNASSAIATTAFVWSAVQESTTGVISWNGRTGVVDLTGTDINDAGGALLDGPAFSGTPTAPTAPVGTATTQLATTAFVLNEVQAIGAGVLTWNTRSGNVVLETTDITGAGGAPIASPAFSGTPTVPTPVSPVASTTTIPNTAWVVQYVTLSSVASFNTRTGNVTLNANDITAAGGLANPNVALTGTPTAPTSVPGTNNTQIATTSFVQSAIANLGGNYVPLAGNVSITGPLTMSGATANLLLNGNATAPLQAVPLQQLNLYAPLASPALSGVPTVPTAPAGTNTTQAASTAFVANAVAPYDAVNYVDNSGFTINQRTYASGTALAAGAYGLDRWKGGASGGTLTFTAAPASTVVTITAGSIQQVIEGAVLTTGPYVLSWTGTATGRIATTSGGGTYAASPVLFNATAGSNTFIEFTGGTLSRVQLQIGSVATPWQPLALEAEASRCRRFYQFIQCINGGDWTPGYAYYAGGPYTPPMRATPSLSITNNASTNTGSVSTSSQPAGVWASAFAVAAGAAIINVVIGASADL